MATIQEVAKYANVSVGSVSRYLNGYQLRPENAKRIEAAIKALNYRENMMAKALKSNQSLSIGVLVNNMTSNFSASLIATMEIVFEKQGYSMLLNGYLDDPEEIRRKIEFLTARGVDGLVVLTAEETWPGTQILQELTIPVVSVVTPMTFTNVDSIIINDDESTETVITKMLQAGHEKIGIIAAPQNNYVARQRLNGVRAAYQAVGQVLPEDMLFYGDYSRESGYDGMTALLAQDITAVFVCNYNMSLGAIQKIQELELKIGTDISFASFDYFDASEVFYPKLTVIKQPVTEIGLLAANRVLERIKQKDSQVGQQFTVENEILWRDSIKIIEGKGLENE